MQYTHGHIDIPASCRAIDVYWTKIALNVATVLAALNYTFITDIWVCLADNIWRD